MPVLQDGADLGAVWNSSARRCDQVSWRASSIRTKPSSKPTTRRLTTGHYAP